MTNELFHPGQPVALKAAPEVTFIIVKLNQDMVICKDRNQVEHGLPLQVLQLSR